MVEAKWRHDLSYRTTHDLGRNQLARVIETALTFQNQKHRPAFPEQVFVTLLTPAYFKAARNRGKRYYAYKFAEYEQDKAAIRRDVEDAAVRPRVQPGLWEYPDLAERLEALSLCWVTYEELIAAMPGSDYKQALEQFIESEPCSLLYAVGAGAA
jgi:hypothetical protein